MASSIEFKNFKYLDNSIKNNSNVLLNSDITLEAGEEENYLDGICISGDVVIDGADHVIDGCGKSRIFNIASGDVTLKNIIFKNASHMEDGGAIKHDEGKLTLINCKFIDNYSKTNGSAISCSWKSIVKIENCCFSSNRADEIGCIYNLNGNVNVYDSKFLKNEKSCILNQRRGRLRVGNCKFIANAGENGAGIANFGKCDVFDSFFKNNASSSNGGAINSQSRSVLKVLNSKFIQNKAGSDGGAIINFSRADIGNALFLDNLSENHGGALSNQKNGRIKILNSDFINNSSVMTGGAAMNWGYIDVSGLKFENNSVKEFGGGIFNQEDATFKISSSQFIGNSSDESGGAIMNWAKVTVIDTLFDSNSANLGGAINSSKKAHLNVLKSEFIRNSSKNGSAIFNNSYDSNVFACKFHNHSQDNVVYNFKSMSFTDCKFTQNNSENVIFNDEDAKLKVSGGEFKANVCGSSAVYNVGRLCILSKIIFEANKSDINYADIYNRSNLTITDLKFKSKDKTVLNKGTLNVKKMSQDQIKTSVENLKTVNDFSKDKISRFDFGHLDKLVNSKPRVKLTRDYCLERYELDFYEGGIEIKNDDLVLDGQGHVIDGMDMTRIFIVNAQNVVFKNIIFKNGLFSNSFDKYASGGGAIHVLKNGSVRLENCSFLENKSCSNGGAIFNDGCIKSFNSKFIANESRSFGGAIDNKSTLTSSNDEFKNNRSRMGGAIYNRGHLTVKNIDLEDNESHFKQSIYNAHIIDADDELNDSIYDSSKIKAKPANVKPFEHLANEIENSNEVKLDNDLVFDYKNDYMLKHKFNIKKDLVIDGCNHTIEYNLLEGENFIISGSGSSSLFKIKDRNVKVVLKNIIFKNCYSNGRDIIENHGNLIIKNCKFINTRLTSGNAFINNKNSLKVFDSYFSNNIASKQSIIVNSSEMDISDTKFINNISQTIGSCITNEGEANIKHTVFKSNNTKDKAACIYNDYEANLKMLGVDFMYNDADVDGGAIYNYGELDIYDSRFIGNLARDEGGAINNRTSGNINVENSEFANNESKTNGGAIFSYGRVKAFKCIFKENAAKRRAGAIEHTRPLDKRVETYLKVSDCELIGNRSPDNNDIYGYDGGDVKIENCQFR